MRHSVVLLLLISGCVLPACIDQLLYFTQRGACRVHFDEIKSQVPAREIQTISFPLHAIIEWEKEGKEFMLNGKLYDVISAHKTELLIILKCVQDTKEEHVLCTYFRHFNRSNPNDDPNRPLKVKSIKYFQARPGIMAGIVFMTPEFIQQPMVKVLSAPLEVYSPPPEDYYALVLT